MTLAAAHGFEPLCCRTRHGSLVEEGRRSCSGYDRPDAVVGGAFAMSGTGVST